MSTYKKYAIAPDGRLVDRKSGKAIRNAKTLEIRGNRVYMRGKLNGYIGKPTTKKAQRAMEKYAKTRQTRARRASERELEKAVDELSNVEGLMDAMQGPDTGWKTLATAKRAWYETPPEFREDMELSINEQSMMNFASALRSLVDEGIITTDDANFLFSEYENADDTRRSEMWNQLHKLASEHDYIISSPPNALEEYGRYYDA